MALKIYLVRHGETDTNKQDKKWGQHPDIPLNELGIEQANRLLDRLKSIKFNKIFSSDLRRAAQTTEILVKKIDAPLIIDKRLREYDSGEVDQSSDKWRKKYYELLESGIPKEEIRPYGGDNIWDLIKRVKSLIQDLEKEKGTILMVSHSGFNEAFINLSQLREKGNFVKIKQDNTCINILEYKQGKWIIKVINDSNHISEFMPEIKIYENQEEIKERAKKQVLEKLGDLCEKIILAGDIVENKMGYYDRPHKRHKGSTIEIFTEFKEGFKVPSDWKISEINESLKKYELGSMEINGFKHKFNVTTPISIIDKSNAYEVIKEDIDTIMGVPIGYYSMKILKEPTRNEKGAIILSQVDNVLEKMPFVKDKFYIIERRGWRGLNESKYADIKLVEDISFLDETLKTFPNCICLDIGPADFIDTDKFKPLGIKKEYTGIQISQWAEFKRPEMFIRASALTKRKFLKLGHLMDGGTIQEIEYRNSMIKLAKEIGADIDFPFSDAKSNKDFPGSKEEMNEEINKAYMGILTTRIEGINRFKMECLSANIPVLVPEDACYPTKKHINEKTGAFFEPTPEGLANAIEDVLKNIHKYSPREYLLQNTGKKKSLDKLKEALKTLCLRDRTTDIFQNIDWDGRNQSLIWGKHVFEELKKYSYETS